MIRSITGARAAAVVLAGAVAAATPLLAGCGTGQMAATAEMKPAVMGSNADAGLPNGSVSVRNAIIRYRPGGYPAGGNAPLDLRLVNNTPEPVVVEVAVHATDADAVVLLGGPGSPSATPDTPRATASLPPIATPPATGSPQPTATPVPTESPARPAGRPAKLTIPAGGFLILSPSGGGEFLQVVGLKERRLPGESVTLVFTFDGATRLDVPTSVGVSLTPLPRASGVPAERHGA